MDKMSVAKQAETRKALYAIAIKALNDAGFVTEPFVKGILIELEEGYFAKMAISINDATKFDLDETRAEYQEKVEKARVATEKAAQKASEKVAEDERKAAEKAAKAAEKAAKEVKAE